MKSSILTAVLSGFLAMTLAGNASAEASKVKYVHLNANSAGGQLAIGLTSGVVLFAAADAQSQCPAISAEVLRTWTSLAQSAFLAGKELDSGYTVTPFAKCINWITLQ